MQVWMRLLPALIVIIIPAAAWAQDADGDGIPDVLEVRLGTDPQVRDELIPIGESPAKENGPDLRCFYMCHVGGDRFLWRVEFAEAFPKTGDVMVFYVDADNDAATGRQDKPECIGTDVQYSCSGTSVSATVNNRAIYAQGQSAVRGRAVGNVVWFCDDVQLKREGGQAIIRFRVLLQRQGGGGDATDWMTASIPLLVDRALPELPGLDTLTNKGLQREDVEPPPGARDNLPPRRPRPQVPFAAAGRAAARGATVERERVPVNLLEEAGMAREDELVRAGVPFAPGVLFDPALVRVLNETGNEVPAQVTVTSFWPDDSIRWALIEFLAHLPPRGQCDYVVEYGSAVRRRPLPDSLVIDDTAEALIVTTGPLQATVSKRRGTIIEQAVVDGKPVGGLPRGLVVVGEDGTAYTTANAVPQVRVEKQGPLSATIRLEMPYVSDAGEEYQRAIVRLTFVAGSPTVFLDATHINDWLQTEFTDLRSITLPLEIASRPSHTLWVRRSEEEGLYIEDQGGLGPAGRIMQKTDQLASRSYLQDENHEGLRLEGGMDYVSARGEGVGVCVLDFWQEYPKALSGTDERALVEILPPLQGEDFWKDLPAHVRFPFVEGCYRFKWGMAKTTRLSLEFHGPRADSRVPWQYATLQHPLIPVLPSDYYAATGALGPMAPKRADRFAPWDEYVAQRFADHLQLKEKQREYGFFNWGDWYGERGRNWGNNEYDLPHGLFMQFARTGNRDYFRLALAGARHQADVDCVHAYPDIMNLGAMAPHSVCHTGEWSEQLANPSWSYAYNIMTTAANGHTWADGMVDAWYLTGEPRVMEVAIGLGEHIAFAMAPTFTHLGTHERSGGWSLKAIMAIYRATRDPVYLEAARKICEVALREQDLQGTGAWPHVLPSDHAAGVPGAVGNVAFLIGILMTGMADYHAETGDPRVLASLQGGCRWLREVMWIPERWHFHYTSSPGYLNHPEKSSSGVTMEIIPPMAYLAQRTGDAELMDIVAQAFAAVVRDGGSGFGKSLAQALYSAAEVMSALDQADASRPAIALAQRLDLDELRREQYRGAGWAPRLGMRGPTDKMVYLLRAASEPFVVTATRSRYGARPRGMERGTIELIGPDGKVLKRADYDTDEEYQFRADLGASAPRGVYTVRISDDQRAVWDVDSSEGKRVIELVEGLALGGIGTGKWVVYAPAGVTRFRLTVTDWHRGRFGAMVLGPAGEVLDWCEVVQTTEGGQERGVLEVDLGANPDGRLVPIVLSTSQDLSVAVEGIPPYLAPRPEAWFDPRAR